MKKKFKAKVSGMFDIVQLGDDTFSEVVDKLKANDYHIDQQFTSREECYIEAIGDSGTKSVSRGDMVYKDSAGKEIHEGDSLMDLTPGFVGEISEVFLDEDEGELAVNQDGTTIYLYEIDTEVSSLIVNEETMNIEKEETGGEEKCAVVDTTTGVEPWNLYRFQGTREECLAYIQEHLNEPNLGIIP